MEAYTFQRTDLASRSLAAQERATIESLLSTNDTVKVDLAKVSSISESYADELFGVLVLQRGLEYVTKHLRIVNAADSVLRPIAVAMKRRVAAA
ncbi:DUF4325 domain-containing protein [Pseudomonas fluorescens]|uniref:STAS-like domain-containing protein n=1 Tax=Pseudomonas proteolytica TaxID=219574 RepID=UPI000EA989F6|nr:DUF4325 domain-containing protein [Pseudomonas fluorescens]